MITNSETFDRLIVILQYVLDAEQTSFEEAVLDRYNATDVCAIEYAMADNNFKHIYKDACLVLNTLEGE